MKYKVTVNVKAVGEMSWVEPAGGIAWDNEELRGIVDMPDEVLEADVIEDIVEQIYNYIDITVKPGAN